MYISLEIFESFFTHMKAKIAPKKIAVLRFSSIGDIVLISPILRALYQANQYEIHFVTKRSFAMVNIHNKYVAKQHLFDKDPREILKTLKEESFDFVVDLQKNIRSNRLRRLLQCPTSTFPKLNVKKWMLVNLKLDVMPDVHIVERYFEALQSLEHERDGAGLDMFVGPENEVSLDEYGLEKEAYIAVVLGAAHFTKRIPLSILADILGKTEGKVALIGGPAEAKIGEELANLYPAKTINFCGRTNLQQSASLIEKSRKVLTADTGMMHIAAAFHKKIFVLWGNTVPQFGMYPYYGHQTNRAHFFAVPDLSCRPCSKIGFDSCPKGHFDCMKKQDVNQIVKMLNQNLV